MAKRLFLVGPVLARAHKAFSRAAAAGRDFQRRGSPENGKRALLAGAGLKKAKGAVKWAARAMGKAVYSKTLGMLPRKKR